MVFPAVAVTMLMLIGVFAVSGSHNTHRWVRFGDLFTFQPSELAKPVLVLFLAYFLQTRIHQMDDWKGTILAGGCCALAFTALILKEPDLGTGLVCMAVTALMLYLAGARTRYFAIGAALASPVLYYMLFFVKFRRDRMLAFINPEADPRGTGFHILQSLIAVGTGGIRGLGLMEGRQKLFYLPEVQTDFIFANICEELGLIGALLVVGLFVALGYRGLRAAFLSTDPFARFLAFGIDDGDFDPGVLQYERGAGAAADEGNSAAVYLFGRNFDFYYAGQHGCAAEYYARDRLGWASRGSES